MIELVENGSRAQTVDLWMYPLKKPPKPFWNLPYHREWEVIIPSTHYILPRAKIRLTFGIEAVARSNLVLPTVTLAN